MIEAQCRSLIPWGVHAYGIVLVMGVSSQEELSIRDEADPLVVSVTSDWEVKQTSSLVTGNFSPSRVGSSKTAGNVGFYIAYFPRR